MSVTREVSSHGTIIYRNSEGQIHREDGPAAEFVSGNKYWYLNDVEYTKEEYDCKILELNPKTYEEYMAMICQ